MDGAVPNDAQLELLRYYDEIRSAISDHVRNMQLAEDLTQDTFCRAFRALARKHQIRNTPAWLHAIARNVVRDHCNRMNRGIPLEEIDFDQQVDNREADCVAENSLWNCDPAAFARALHELRPLTRMIVVAYYYEGKDCGSIGAELGLARRTVNYRLHSARRNLRRKLRKRGAS